MAEHRDSTVPPMPSDTVFLRPPSPSRSIDSSSGSTIALPSSSSGLPPSSGPQSMLAPPMKPQRWADPEYSAADVGEVYAPGEERPPGVDEKAAEEGWLVQWDGPDDPGNPRNWPRAWRWYVTTYGGVLTLNAAFASSAPVGIIPQLIEEWGISNEVATLLIAIFVVGYCVGPLLWGPLSETYGRRPIFIICFTLYTIFQIACAVAPNAGALVTFRFFSGMFAACPLTNAGAILADMWDADTRGKSMALFGLAPFAGPALGPIVSGYMTVAGVHWRWIFWVLAIFAGLCTIGLFPSMPETFAPLLLSHKAKAMRVRTGDSRYYSALEKADKDWRSRVYHILARPFKILFLEPMLIALTVYMSFVYGCIYLLFEAFPIVFTIGHGLNEGASGLMFLPLFVGGVSGTFLYILYFNPRYEKHMAHFAPHPVPPEFRLEMAFLGAPLFAIGFFWFGWTSYPSISFWSPMIATTLLGFGVVLIFLSLFNYIVDVYLVVAASALAASTVVRSLFGAGFPLFATQMYDKMNPRWASTLLGAIAALMIPIPFVLRAWGPTLRKKSRFAPTKGEGIGEQNVGDHI